MEVYVLIKNDLDVDGGIFETEVVGVYETFSQAERKMQVLMNEARDSFEEKYDIEQDEYVEGDMSWSIWELGEYATNHIDLIIQCKEIEQSKQREPKGSFFIPLNRSTVRDRLPDIHCFSQILIYRTTPILAKRTETNRNETIWCGYDYFT